MSVPSPAMSAAEVIAYIRKHGGRVFRFARPPVVFVLTSSYELVEWMVEHGARVHVPTGMGLASDGSYSRDSVTNSREWDVVISRIPVADVDEVGHAIWKAAA